MGDPNVRTPNLIASPLKALPFPAQSRPARGVRRFVDRYSPVAIPTKPLRKPHNA